MFLVSSLLLSLYCLPIFTPRTKAMTQTNHIFKSPVLYCCIAFNYRTAYKLVQMKQHHSFFTRNISFLLMLCPSLPINLPKIQSSAPFSNSPVKPPAVLLRFHMNIKALEPAGSTPASPYYIQGTLILIND